MTTSSVVNGIPDGPQRGPEKEGPWSRAGRPGSPEFRKLPRQLGDQGAPEVPSTQEMGTAQAKTSV